MLLCLKFNANQYLLLCCDNSGGRDLKDEYGLYDGMTPLSALVGNGLVVAIYFTKPPARGVNNQDAGPVNIH